MAKKPILRREDTNGSDPARQMRAQIRMLKPKAGDILVISGDTPGLDPEGFARSVQGFVPPGVRFLFVPEGIDVSVMTEEMFNSLGYYRADEEE